MEQNQSPEELGSRVCLCSSTFPSCCSLATYSGLEDVQCLTRSCSWCYTRLNSQPSAGLSLKPQDLVASVAAGRQNHRSLAGRKENDKGKIPPKAKRVKMASAFVFNRRSFAVYRSLLYRFPCCVGKGLEMLNGRESETGASMGRRGAKGKRS